MTALIAMKIEIRSAHLTDGSVCFDVWFGSTQLQAVTESDAAELAMKIQHAIHDHTNDSVEIVFTY